MIGYDDPATQDPNKRDLYEDQHPPHAPAVPGNGGEAAPVEPAPESEVHPEEV